MKRVNRFRTNLGNINAAGNGTANVTGISVTGGTNAVLILWSMVVSMTTATDFTLDVLVGGTPVFTQRVIQALGFGNVRLGPPDGTYIECPAGPAGQVSIRLTNHAGSASAQNDVTLYFTVRDVD